MFENLTARIQDIVRKAGRRGRLRPEEIDEILRQIRLALLEADVHYSVVTDLLGRVKEQASRQMRLSTLNPGQQVLSVLHKELVATLGEPDRLALRGPRPRAVMLVGLQGSGKTTTAAKLARYVQGKGERPLLVAADVSRPAAVEQLQILGEELGIDVYHQPGQTPVGMAQAALRSAERGGQGVVIIDTAGRSQLDSALMEELKSIAAALSPTETLLVADAMTGQEAVNIAHGFNQRLALTGLILTKMDGDARGGAAISMRAITGVPIKFIGVGEGRKALQPFEPTRLASRILGMGDVATLVETAEREMNMAQAERQVERLQAGQFNLEDFAAQLDQLRALGPLGRVLELLPTGMASGMMGRVDSQQAERQLLRTRAILSSMTREERRKPKLLNGSRKRRIAAGSGTSVQEVNQLLHRFRTMRKMFKQLGKSGLGGVLPGLR